GRATGGARLASRSAGRSTARRLARSLPRARLPCARRQPQGPRCVDHRNREAGWPESAVLHDQRTAARGRTSRTGSRLRDHRRDRPDSAWSLRFACCRLDSRQRARRLSSSTIDFDFQEIRMPLSDAQLAGLLALMRERLTVLEEEISRKLGDSAEDLNVLDRVGDTGDLSQAIASSEIDLSE